ncbi:hypothetical protein [Flammeovirga aprica]|uniref:Uncharacterized protein n=1 Tax=Flammeovirga aprica JL-4 TaxID=694437 RepID=A0A7X9RTE6_9BACT|nr:hypothetical protein [Flammeovirga aprica]NME67142.1 hypothetical protein [Flammeovirga aprica JL-4]
MILLFNKCKSECDHCNEGTGSISQYQIVNGIDSELIVEIYGQSLKTSIELEPNDTSDFWVRIAYPAELESTFFSLDRNNNGQSFPYDSDSIAILLNGEVQRKYIQNIKDQDLNWETSIYNEFSAYESIKIEPSSENVYSYYYIIDSAKLGLSD